MPRPPRKVALVFGGQSPEHEVSIESAARVAAAMDELEATETVPVYVSKKGKWHWSRPAAGAAPGAAAGGGSGDLVAAVKAPESFARLYQPGGLEFAQALLHLSVDDYACVFIIIHGAGGEDGRLQGALDLAGIRYAGSGAAASSLALDKPRCQAYLKARGLPVPEFVALEAAGSAGGRGEEIVLERIGLPCVVKPALGGSSVGVSIVEDQGALKKALETAFAMGATAHVEKFVRGRELTCGVIVRGGEPTALPVTEILPPDGRFFDYEAKYTAGVSREITPARIDAALTGRVQALAVQAHRAVGCEGFSRTDFMADEGGPKILEINTLPGMTGTSLLPQAAAAAGIDFAALVDLILTHAESRALKAAHAREEKART